MVQQLTCGGGSSRPLAWLVRGGDSARMLSD
jgi:hypothetical protein